MKSLLICLMAGSALLMSGCATRAGGGASAGDECCGKPEVVYVDKAVAECTRSVQRITQVSPCASCDRFPVTARLDDVCSK